MKFSEFIFESNVNGLVLKTNKVVFDGLDESIFQLLKTHSFQGMFEDDESLQPFLNDIKKYLKQTITGYINKTQLEMGKIVKSEIEQRIGPITPYNKLPPELSDEEKAKSLWWVGDIVVWLEDKNTPGTSASGYFLASSENMLRDANQKYKFPDSVKINPNNRLWSGINIGFNYSRLIKEIQEATIDQIITQQKIFSKLIITDNLQEILHNIIATYAHEATHLLQYIKQNIATRVSAIKDGYNKKNKDMSTVWTEKNYMSKKTLKSIIRQEISSWSKDISQEVYMATAIEIDAHAVSVASKILLNSKRNDSFSEIAAILGYLDQLKEGYIDNSDSMDAYVWGKDNATEKRQFQSVWKRFLKKIYLILDDRIREINQLK